MASCAKAQKSARRLAAGACGLFRRCERVINPLQVANLPHKARGDRFLRSRLGISVTLNQLLTEPRSQGAIIVSRFFRTLLRT
jgi:hypothetical protein